MANCEKIVICGFSGAGKSSLLTEIQRNAPAGWSFSDLDQLIVEQSSESSVASLVDKIGWQKFREKEFERLMEWLGSPGKSVLSLGGGALIEETFKLLSSDKKVKIIYLHSDFETCWKRLNLPGAEIRPLVLKGKEHMKDLYQKRSSIFKKVSQRLENKEGTKLSDLAARFWQMSLS